MSNHPKEVRTTLDLREPPRFEALLRSFPKGPLEIPPSSNVVICVCLGPIVRLSLRGDGRKRYGIEVPGDVHITPPGAPSRWEADVESRGLLMIVPQPLLADVAAERGLDGACVEVASRFLGRDPWIEHIGGALEAEIEAGNPSGRLFLDSLGTALAAHLIDRHSSHARSAPGLRGGLSGARLKRLLVYIEENLERSLSLAELADVADLSVSHVKAAFRQSMGMPMHQYVVRRRVERAKAMLGDERRPTSEIAASVGFANQSHLARHMRRILGVTPSALRRTLTGRR